MSSSRPLLTSVRRLTSLTWLPTEMTKSSTPASDTSRTRFCSRGSVTAWDLPSENNTNFFLPPDASPRLRKLRTEKSSASNTLVPLFWKAALSMWWSSRVRLVVRACSKIALRLYWPTPTLTVAPLALSAARKRSAKRRTKALLVSKFFWPTLAELSIISKISVPSAKETGTQGTVHVISGCFQWFGDIYQGATHSIQLSELYSNRLECIKKEKLTGTFVVWAFLLWMKTKQWFSQFVRRPNNTVMKMTAVSVCVQVCAHVYVFTLTNWSCEVLQEGVFQQFSKVVPDEGETWFRVALTHHISDLLWVGRTTWVVFDSYTTHLAIRKQVLQSSGNSLWHQHSDRAAPLYSLGCFDHRVRWGEYYLWKYQIDRQWERWRLCYPASSAWLCCSGRTRGPRLCTWPRQARPGFSLSYAERWENLNVTLKEHHQIIHIQMAATTGLSDEVAVRQEEGYKPTLGSTVQSQSWCQNQLCTHLAHKTHINAKMTKGIENSLFLEKSWADC